MSVAVRQWVIAQLFADQALTREIRALVAATIEVESGFEPRALRDEPKIGDASRGLGQILLRTARALGFAPAGKPDTLFDPAVNLALTKSLLVRLWTALAGDVGAIASAYNCGLRDALGARVDVPGQGMAPYTSWCRRLPQGFSNEAHVAKVLAAYARWREVFPAALSPPDPGPKPPPPPPWPPERADDGSDSAGQAAIGGLVLVIVVALVAGWVWSR